jgi:hypothetical protein
VCGVSVVDLQVEHGLCRIRGGMCVSAHSVTQRGRGNGAVARRDQGMEGLDSDAAADPGDGMLEWHRSTSNFESRPKVPGFRRVRVRVPLYSIPMCEILYFNRVTQ